MKLVEFSVTNYRSITSAEKIKIDDLTILVGKNNEGKSNILTALNIAMHTVIVYGRTNGKPDQLFRFNEEYVWERDFPKQLQNRKSGFESRFRLLFELNETEKTQFRNSTGIRGNELIPIEVKISKDNKPKVNVPKQGTRAYNEKAPQIASFISRRISINYIPAVRTEGMALTALQDVIFGELNSLHSNMEYIEARNKVMEYEQGILDGISEQLFEPLQVFIPDLKAISIQQEYADYSPRLYNRLAVTIDDGVATNIKEKGDGIKNLVALAILQDRRKFDGASVIAIEEPESHLHSGAIHSLVEIINRIADNSQVIITTHNPLFVQQNRVSNNIIVDSGKARPAKSISEIRNVLGVLPSDNLKNARFVLVVEGEDDKISLTKILPKCNSIIGSALNSNQLVIKPLYGAGNLGHDLQDLRNTLCKYVVLMDNDSAGNQAIAHAREKNLLNDSQVKQTIVNGYAEAEFEDAIDFNIYKNDIETTYNISLSVPQFRGNKKWSDRMREVFLSQGCQWNDKVEKEVKHIVANSIPTDFDNCDSIIDPRRSNFISGLCISILNMLEE